MVAGSRNILPCDSNSNKQGSKTGGHDVLHYTKIEVSLNGCDMTLSHGIVALYQYCDQSQKTDGIAAYRLKHSNTITSGKGGR